ncbi:MAG: serine/threonine protein kinase [Nanoarchaeota archaeon]|nr:serine/threonine protein kinase [Nanoarchaeota archaeon]
MAEGNDSGRESGGSKTLLLKAQQHPQPYQLEEGAEIFEPVKYTLLKMLGKGGMGEVWEVEAKHPSGHRQRAAMKVVTCLPNETEALALLKETHKLGQFQHDNIAAFIGGGIVRERPFVVVQKVNGPNLEELAEMHGLMEENMLTLAATPSRTSPCMIKIPDELVGLIMFLQTRAFSYCHDVFDLIHRDITPDNTMIDMANGFVKVIDFGIAEDSYVLAHTDEISGKVHYIAPEVFMKHPATKQTDIVSLGLTGYRMISGLRPYSTLNPDENIQQIVGHLFQNIPTDGKIELVTPLDRIVNGVDSTLAAIIASSVAHNPDERFQSMRALHNSLRTYLYSKGVGPTTESLKTYLKLLVRWGQKIREDPSRPVSLESTGFTKEERNDFPFYEKPEEHLLVQYNLTADAAKALQQRRNPALQNVMEETKRS